MTLICMENNFRCFSDYERQLEKSEVSEIFNLDKTKKSLNEKIITLFFHFLRVYK